MIDQESVTDAWGVPTVWLGLLNHMRQTNTSFTALQRVLIGGSAAPRAMIEEFAQRHGVEGIQGWGMTEMNPLGTISIPTPEMHSLSLDEQLAVRVKQGRAAFVTVMKIVDADGKRLPHDGKAFGELLVRGPATTSGYYENPEANAKAFDEEGWFRTGDVAIIDPDGFMEIVDRVKDVIKSGGEWISSIDLENEAVGHPEIAEAAVIGVHHVKWGERPLLVVVRAEGSNIERDDVLDFLRGRVADDGCPTMWCSSTSDCAAPPAVAEGSAASGF